MKLFALALAFLLATPASAGAQDWEFGVPGLSVYATTECHGDQVLLDVDFTVLQMLPEVYDALAGWIVTREVVGACVDEVVIGPMLPLPTTSQIYTLPDTPDVPLRNTIYRIWAVDHQGQRIFVRWPQRTAFAQANCGGGPIARGVVTLHPNTTQPTYRLEVCPDQCWWGLSYFDGFLPPETAAYEGQVIDVFGPIYAGMEGPYVDVQFWTPNPQSCDVEIVAVEDRSWGSVKGSYR